MTLVTQSLGSLKCYLSDPQRPSATLSDPQRPSATHGLVHWRKSLKKAYQQLTSTVRDCQRGCPATNWTQTVTGVIELIFQRSWRLQQPQRLYGNQALESTDNLPSPYSVISSNRTFERFGKLKGRYIEFTLSENIPPVCAVGMAKQQTFLIFAHYSSAF